MIFMYEETSDFLGLPLSNNIIMAGNFTYMYFFSFPKIIVPSFLDNLHPFKQLFIEKIFIIHIVRQLCEISLKRQI